MIWAWDCLPIHDNNIGPMKIFFAKKCVRTRIIQMTICCSWSVIIWKLSPLKSERGYGLTRLMQTFLHRTCCNLWTCCVVPIFQHNPSINYCVCHSATNDDIRMRWCRKDHVLWRTVASYSNTLQHGRWRIVVTSGIAPLLLFLKIWPQSPVIPNENPRWHCAILNIHHGLIYRIWKGDAARRIAVIEDYVNWS